MALIDHPGGQMSVVVLAKFDDTCAPSLSVLMGFDGNVKPSVLVDYRDTNLILELDLRSQVLAGLLLTT
jgi:hypothetical protein